jgi:hypothetical protein
MVAGVNLLPLAGALRSWMLQRGQLSFLSAKDRDQPGGYTNPYAFGGSALALVVGRVVNSHHDYCATQTADHNEVDAEIERLRLYNEILLYGARFCEVAIKQLLYCANIPESQYARMALGSLLEHQCPGCRKQNGKKPHKVSFVGTLAHPFRLCLEFELCTMDHMDLVNRLRNAQAAHSDIQTMNVRSVEESKAQLLKEGDEVLSGFLHMLSHLEKLEDRMLDDLAEKGAAINYLKLDGLKAEDCNFNLVPGQRFVFLPNTSHAGHVTPGKPEQS